MFIFFLLQVLVFLTNVLFFLGWLSDEFFPRDAGYRLQCLSHRNCPFLAQIEVLVTAIVYPGPRYLPPTALNFACASTSFFLLAPRRSLIAFASSWL